MKLLHNICKIVGRCSISVYRDLNPLNKNNHAMFITFLLCRKKCTAFRKLRVHISRHGAKFKSRHNS